MESSFEKLHSQLSENIYYKEFSFSKTDFTPTPGAKKEFADHVTWLDDLLIIYQLKERKPGETYSANSEGKWFENKVIKKAVKQVKDTLSFLEDNNEIELRNHKNHSFKVKRKDLRRILKVVIYAPSKFLPFECLQVKFKNSSSAGFIHLIPWKDYLGVCTTLITPAELAEYLEWRESVLKKWHSRIEMPSEKALVGQFLSIHLEEQPTEDYAYFVENLKDNPSDFDLSSFLEGMGEHIIYFEGFETELGYYDILTEFAKLPRGDLYELKKRILLCIQKVQEDKFMRPTRMVSSSTHCGFVLIPVRSEFFDHRKQGLRNFTQAAKYDSRLQKQAGISISMKGDFFYIEWALLDYEWRYDDELEGELKRNNPFGKLKYELRPRYNFKE